MNYELTIVVPIYNVVQYLRHCLQSLEQQGLTDYEVLLVNDASRDNSQGICSEWCQTHPHFRLINHSHNMGLSEARNTGLREARGQFVTFVDSDDFLAPGTLSAVLAEMKKAGESQITKIPADNKVDGTADNPVDVIEYPVEVYHLSKTPHRLTFTPRDIDFATWCQEGGHHHCYAWNKVYRLDLWQGTAFPAGLHYEDILTIPYVLRKARVIRQTNVGLYYYCRRQGSICTSAHSDSLKQYAMALNRLMTLPEEVDNDDLYLRARNAEMTYHKVSDTNEPLINRRRPALSAVWANGQAMGNTRPLNLHDRLKLLYLALFS